MDADIFSLHLLCCNCIHSLQPRSSSIYPQDSRQPTRHAQSKTSDHQPHQNTAYSNKNYEYHRAEPLHPPPENRRYPSPKYLAAQDLSSTNTAKSKNDQNGFNSGSSRNDYLEEYTRSPKQTKKPAGGSNNQHQSKRETQADSIRHLDSKSHNERSDTTAASNGGYIPESPVGFSVISPVSSGTPTLSAGSNHSPRVSVSNKTPYRKKNSIGIQILLFI